MLVGETLVAREQCQGRPNGQPNLMLLRPHGKFRQKHVHWI